MIHESSGSSQKRFGENPESNGIVSHHEFNKTTKKKKSTKELLNIGFLSTMSNTLLTKKERIGLKKQNKDDIKTTGSRYLCNTRLPLIETSAIPYFKCFQEHHFQLTFGSGNE